MTKEQIDALARIYCRGINEACLVAEICDTILDPSGALLGEVRNSLWEASNNQNKGSE